MKLTKLLFAAFTLLFVVSCGSGKKNDSDSSTKLKGAISIDGSSTVFPITEAVAEEFKKIEADVRVSIGVSGTGGGFKKFGKGELDICNASREIKDKEIAKCDSAGIGYVGLEVAYDGLCVVVNPKNTWVTSITVEELKKIWEPAAQGKIMKWNQIRPEWPNKEIHLFGPGVASGTFDYFTEEIVGEKGSSRGDFTASEDDNVLVQGVSSDEFGLAFFGLAYYEGNKDKLKLVAVDNGNGPVLPTLETVSSNKYSPLSRPLLIYVTKQAIAKPEVVAFVEFYLENAPALSKDAGYIPLSAEVYAKSKEKFKAFLAKK